MAAWHRRPDKDEKPVEIFRIYKDDGWEDFDKMFKFGLAGDEATLIKMNYNAYGRQYIEIGIYTEHRQIRCVLFQYESIQQLSGNSTAQKQVNLPSFVSDIQPWSDESSRNMSDIFDKNHGILASYQYCFTFYV